MKGSDAGSSEVDSGQASCPACGNPNPRGFRFCGACGASLGRVCSTCGAEVPSGFRFCGVCGSPQVEGDAPPDAELEERKVVTVLFADLTASTELASRLDPEDLRVLLRTFFEAMVEEIERLDGTVEKFIGDAIVAVFGVPMTHEDDPERAVRAALAMQRRMAPVNEDFADSSGIELAMRIGVNTGEVVTATGVDRENLVMGEPVNVAARFQALAGPGGIVVGERTYRDTQHTIDYRSLGDVTVKGIDRPLPAWEVTGELDLSAEPVPRRGSVGVAPMVGRDGELELLELLFSRTLREGGSSLVTLLGPAGIGKSRLAHEFGQRVRSANSVRIVRGRCLPYGEGLTYWPMAEILKADAGIMDSDQPQAILEKAEDALQGRFRVGESSMGTVQVLLSSIGVPVQPDPLAGAEPAAAKELIARSWKGYFESLGSDQPVLALLEDLHWADASLLDLVEYLAARVSGRVMFVAMARPDLAERRPGWGGGLRSSTTVSLSPLSSEDGEHMIRHLLDELPAPSEAIQPLLARAEGNPFYAQELLRMVIESGSLVRSNGEWLLERPLPASLPDTVQGVIASRIDMLPVQEKRVLQDAAVVGRIFWPGALQRLGSASAQATLDVLVDKGLVWQRGTSVVEGERELIFNHILTRDVAYQSIPKSRRAAAHAEALSWVEEKTTGRDEEFAEILAFHAEQAGDLGKTARYSMLAGHRSRRLFAAREAIQRYDGAIEAAEATGSTDDALVAEIALSRGEAKELLGQFVEAQVDYERALTASGGAAHGHLEAQAMAALAHLYWLQDRFEEGESILADALDKARSVGDTELLARLLYTAGTLKFGRGQYRDALPLHEEALRVAQDGSDLAGEALARHGLCETRYFLGPFDRALAEGKRADELFRSLGQRPMVYHNLYMVAYLLLMKGRLREAIEAFTESIEGCRELGNRRDEGFALGRSVAEVFTGEMRQALADFEEGLDLAVDIRTPRLELALRGFRMTALGELGRFDILEPELDACFELAERLQSTFAVPRLYAMAGWVALRAGDRDRAIEMFTRGQELSEGVLQEVIQIGHVEVLAWEEVGDAAGLRSAAQILGRLAAGETPMFANWAAYGEADAAGITGRWEEALEQALPVGKAALSSGDRMLAWRTSRLLSAALAATGRPWEAWIERARAATILRAIAEDLDDDGHRSSFLARPDVSGLLESVSGPLADLSAESLEAMEAPVERRFHQGEAIFRRGDPGTTIYMVAQGAVRIVESGGDSAEVPLERVSSGEVFGEVGLLDGGPRTADAVADGSTVAFEFGREAFLRLLHAEPTVAGRMLSVLNDRLARASRTAEHAKNGDVAARLAGAIQQVAGAEDRGGTVIEILPVFLKDGEIWWLRPMSGQSLQVEGHGTAHPGDAVAAALARHGVRPIAVHSTSWRFERGRLVVTYLAVLADSDPSVVGFRASEARRRELARGSAFDPPPAIEIDHVVEHALRHLAWLGRDDPVIKDLLDGGWFRALESYEPEPFRSLSDAESSKGR